MRIVLKHERKQDVLETSIPDEPLLNASAEDREAYEAALERSLDVTCLMLAPMDPELKKQFDEIEAYVIIDQLQAMFGKHAGTERFEIVKAILGSQFKNR